MLFDHWSDTRNTILYYFSPIGILNVRIKSVLLPIFFLIIQLRYIFFQCGSFFPILLINSKWNHNQSTMFYGFCFRLNTNHCNSCVTVNWAIRRIKHFCSIFLEFNFVPKKLRELPEEWDGIKQHQHRLRIHFKLKHHRAINFDVSEQNKTKASNTISWTIPRSTTNTQHADINANDVCTMPACWITKTEMCKQLSTSVGTREPNEMPTITITHTCVVEYSFLRFALIWSHWHVCVHVLVSICCIKWLESNTFTRGMLCFNF